MDDLYIEPILALLIGVFLIFFIKARKERKRWILNNFKEVRGIVVGQELEYNRNSQKIYYPTISFEASDKCITKKYNDGFFPIKYKINQEVTIQYSLENPNEFLIKEDQANWRDIIVLFIGIGFIMYSLFLFYKIYFP